MDTPLPDPVVSRIRHLPGAISWLGRVGPGPAPPWWEVLPEEFHRQHERFELSRADQLRVALTAASDGVVRSVAGAVLFTTALPVGFAPWRLPEVREDLAFAERILAGGDPYALFRPPVDGVAITERAGWFAGFRPPDGTATDLAFDSPFEPSSPRVRARWAGKARNRRARARWWRHRDGPRPTILAIHGFNADLYLLNEWFFALPWLYRAGLDVVLFTLPFHGSRQSLASPYSGHGFFSAGFAGMNEAFAQAVHDLRIVVRHLLRDRGVPVLGATGVSLGGFTTALLAATEPELAFAIPNVPVASLVDLVLEWPPIGAMVHGLLGWADLGLADARRGCAPSSPLTWAPLLPVERRMVIGGVADRLAPPNHTRLLWEHWDRCRLHWFPGSHLVHLDRGEYLREIARFLRELGVLPSTGPLP
jgi:hypothetical protein